MRIALTAEGTYPHQYGGVSVWCDQLIRGLPGYDFTIIPVVATGNEPVRWKLPGNVSSMLPIPLWGPRPHVPLRVRLQPRLDALRSPRRSRRAEHVEPVVRELIDVLLSLDPTAQHRFGTVLGELFMYAQSRDLGAALAGEGAVRMLSDGWRERWPAILPSNPATALIPGLPEPPVLVPTLNDAVTAMQLIEHALRPLSYPPVTADVVHAVTNGLGALPALAAKWWYGLPMLVTEHGVYMREQYLHMRRAPFCWPVKDLYLRFLRRLCTLGYLQADVITPGNVYNKRWETQLGADASRVRTVYNGVDPAHFPVLTDEPDVPTISWAGRIDPVKDLSTLLRAFALVLKQMPQARLRIFGSPPPGGRGYLQRCQALAVDLGIYEQATFEGRVPEIRDAYRAGHVVTLCSVTEGFPYTLIEAMACGRACVATDVGGVSEALGDDAGLIVPPRNPAALADACLRLLRDEDLRKRIGAAARARALEHFTVDRAISAFDEMYTLLGTGRPIPPTRLDEASESARGHWIELPPEEESTVIMPRLSGLELSGAGQSVPGRSGPGRSGPGRSGPGRSGPGRSGSGRSGSGRSGGPTDLTVALPALPSDPTVALPTVAVAAADAADAAEPGGPETAVPTRSVAPDQQATTVLPQLTDSATRTYEEVVK